MVSTAYPQVEMEGGRVWPLMYNRENSGWVTVWGKRVFLPSTDFHCYAEIRWEVIVLATADSQVKCRGQIPPWEGSVEGVSNHRQLTNNHGDWLRTSTSRDK